jgi:2-polyprenyl-3-methyl-5-hydroxy-6-metoxy-1,4-benzoquinol methylase
MRFSDIFRRLRRADEPTSINMGTQQPRLGYDLEGLWEELESAVTHDRDPYEVLRSAPVDVVGVCLLDLSDRYPNARRVLPSMPSERDQLGWTGNSGMSLLVQTCAFIRVLEAGYFRYSGRSLEGASVLDYGCGWGRMIRAMYKFTAPENIYGCDPWDRSIELCRKHRLKGQFSLCDFIPRRSPFPGLRFDLIYAFSVFTHLSERTALAVLGACHACLSSEGPLVITVRPGGYWDLEIPANVGVDRAKLKSQHTIKGYAFSPHSRDPINGEITFGDTSISLSYIESHWTDWKIAGVDSYFQDPYQLVVFLKPVYRVTSEESGG